jgi:hypothetical protein
MKLRLPKSYYNLISYLGTAIIFFALATFLFLLLFTSLTPGDDPYSGIIIFIVTPVFIILGLVLIPIGMVRHYRALKRDGQVLSEKLPVLDLNNKRHRNGVIIFSIATFVLTLLTAFGAYETYHFTESVTFCGKVCHEVMHPEYIAYQKSPHARVTCAECHVGTGANWYVKSKLSGLYQVYSVIAKKYPKPIHTPIKNLRPARETCEECHWPQKIYGRQQRKHFYTLSDEENTQWEIDLLMNTGGGNPALGQESGIHWHINPNIEIEYITTHERRAEIPRVILRNKETGEETVFENEYSPLDEDAEFIESRIMDCGDCHNRPSHIYDDPGRFINVAIAANEIPLSLPYIKQAAVEACLEEYTTDEEAQSGIEEYLTSFYADYDVAPSDVEKAVAGTQRAFSVNIFPTMNVRWEHYPDHIGHQTSAGCFRCHDGSHVSAEGQYISNNCDDCHAITAQGERDDMQYSTTISGLDFQHPVDIDEAWTEMPCYECHSSPPLGF